MIQHFRRFPDLSKYWAAATAAAVLIFGLGILPALAQTITPDIYSGLRYRHIGPPGNRTSAVVGVPGDPDGLLHRRLVGRRLEVRGRRDHLDADLRRPAGPVDRRPWPSPPPIPTSSGRAPVRPSSAATSRSGTASTSPPTPGRPGSTWAWRRPAASAAWSSTRATRTSSSSPPSDTATARSRSAASSARSTAGRPGSRCSSSTRTPAVSRSPWIPTTRASSSPGCGRS